MINWWQLLNDRNYKDKMKEAMKDQEQVHFASNASSPNRCNQPSNRYSINKRIVILLLTSTILILLVGLNLKLKQNIPITTFRTQSQLKIEGYISKEEQNIGSLTKNGQIYHSPIQLITNQHQQPNQKFTDILPEVVEDQINTLSPQIKQEYLQNQQERRQKGGCLQIKDSTTSLIDMLKTDSSNRRFGQVAYSPKHQQQRVQFLKTRIGLVANPEVNEGLFMSMFNLQIDEALLPYKQALLPIQYQKVNKLFQLDKVKEELPICIITPSFNNNHNFRIELNLNSIFTQNYSNYFVVVLNDASSDGSHSIFQQYFRFYQIPTDRYAYINNERHEGALSNIYKAGKHYCSEDSIIMSIDGDDELIGRNVFKIFNAQYQRLEAGVVYSNFYYYDQSMQKIMSGFTDEYPLAEKQKNVYRFAPQRFSQLRSFRKVLLNAISEQDLKDENGYYYRTASDMALFFPLLQLSCGKVYKIAGIHYLYNINTGLNDYLNREDQLNADHQIRKKKPYVCQPRLLAQELCSP